MIKAFFILTFICLVISQDINSSSLAIPNAVAKLDVEDFHMIVLGSESSPRYTYWLESDPSKVYSVYFKQFFEILGSWDTKVEESVISPLNWEFSPISEVPEGFYFTLTHIAHPRESQRFKSIIIRNWIAKKYSTNSTCPGFTCLQFDITLEGYQWINPNSSLAFSYWVTSSVNTSAKIETHPYYVGYGNASIKIARTANVTNGEGIRKTVQVISAIFVDPEPIGEKWVKFAHFKDGGRLNHQGSMGFNNETTTYSVADQYYKIKINDIMVFICLFVLFMVVMLGSIWAYNRYQKREKGDYIEIM